MDDSAIDLIQAEVARLLAQERTKCGLSGNLLAAKAGLSQSLISSFEKTPWNPTLATLLRIAAVLEVNLGDILKQAVRNIEKREARKKSPLKD